MFKIIFITWSLLPLTLWASDKKMTASIRPLQSIIANIVDGSKEVDLIIDQNESLHHYQLKPNKVITIANSDVIVLIDRNFEIFLNKILDKFNKDSLIIEVAKLPNIKLLKSEGMHCNHQEDEEHEHHHLAEYDYHLWLDVENVKVMAQEVANIFAKKYPNFADLYKKNLSIFLKKLDELDNRIKAKILLSKNKNFIVTHNAYNYFVKRYGLNEPQAISIDHDHNIGARDLFALQQSIEANNVICIFEEPQFNSKIVEKLQNDTKVKIGKLDAEWGEDDVPIKDVYFNIMDSLADNFSKCLQ